TGSGEGEFDFGFGGGIKIGYLHYSEDKDFNEFQIVPGIELEAIYHDTSETMEGTAGYSGTNFEADFQSVTIVVNATIRFHNEHLTPYLGFGGGLIYMELTDAQGALVSPFGPDVVTGAAASNNSEFTPVFQGIFGLERMIYYPHLSVFVEYKPMFIPDGDFDLQLAGAGNTATFEITNHLNHHATVGLRWTF
ncbi:MAG: hypothetical protein AAFY98_12180, partial [Verrucomicrobiota bacterium]